MRKIAFVPPWYGDNIPGGAETELRGIAKHLKASGLDIEVLTTCVEKFGSDWNINYHKPGLTNEGGLDVRRFKVRKRDVKLFDSINARLMRGRRVSSEDEYAFIRESVNSTDLYTYIREHKEDYEFFVYIPYMFGTTYYGILEAPEKSVVIPCLHEESYAYMSIYKEVLEKVAGIVYLSEAECELANRLYDLSKTKQMVLGAGVDTDFECDADRFISRTGVEDPYILYAGRKDSGKNINLLIDYFREYKIRHEDSPLKLVLIGGGKVEIPEDVKTEVIDMGFVDKEVKYDAYAASLCLCQPSIHESFSIVIMESWLALRPSLVHSNCEVTKNFAIKSNAGLFFENYYEFEGCIDYFIENPDVAADMGKNGREFVLANFTWDVIVRKYTDFLAEISSDRENSSKVES